MSRITNMSLILFLFWHSAYLLPSQNKINNDNPQSDDYELKVKEADGMVYEWALSHGKEIAVGRINTIILNHPGRENNLFLETLIAKVYEYDLSQRGESSDLQKAYDVYLQALERYGDRDTPYLKEAKLLAAQRGSDIDPVKSNELYHELIEQYPSDDPLRLLCFQELGVNALKQGNLGEAEDYYSTVLSYQLSSSQEIEPKVRSLIQRTKKNASVGLFWTAYGSSDLAEVRLAAVKNFLEKYPQIAIWNRQLIAPVIERLEEAASENESVGINSILEKSLSVNLDSTTISNQVLNLPFDEKLESGKGDRVLRNEGAISRIISTAFSSQVVLLILSIVFAIVFVLVRKKQT